MEARAQGRKSSCTNTQYEHKFTILNDGQLLIPSEDRDKLHKHQAHVENRDAIEQALEVPRESSCLQ